MGKFDRGLDWEKMEEAQAPDYIPPPEELAGLPDIIQEQYEARAIPTVSTQNQAYTDYIEANQEAYTQITQPPSNERSHDQYMMDTQNELEAEQEAEITRPPDADNIFSDILTNLGQAEQASSDAVRTWRETPEEELPENIAQGRNFMDDVTFGALAALLGVNVKSEVENILQLGDAAQSFMDEVVNDKANMSASEYYKKYGLVDFSSDEVVSLGSDWPSEFYVQTESGEDIVSARLAKAEIARGSAVNAKLISSKADTWGQEQNKQKGIEDLTTQDVYSFVSMDKDTRFDNSFYVEDKARDMVNNPDKLGEFSAMIIGQPERVDMRVTKAGIVSNRPVVKVEISDNAGLVDSKEVMVYVSSGRGAPGRKAEGSVHAITGWSADGWFEKIGQQVDKIALEGGWNTAGSLILNAAEDKVRAELDAGFWPKFWYDNYSVDQVSGGAFFGIGGFD
jgi:hypothetical protein